MSLNPNCLLSEQAKIVHALGSVAPSTSTPKYVCLKGYSKLTIVIGVKNTTAVTGSAIALLQATNVGNASGKTLAFSTARVALDTANTDALADFTVSSNTFTTNNVNSLEHLYEITIDEGQLDVANNFDCVRLVTGNSTNATLSVTYILWPAKFGRTTPLTALAD